MHFAARPAGDGAGQPAPLQPLDDGVRVPSIQPGLLADLLEAHSSRAQSDSITRYWV